MCRPGIVVINVDGILGSKYFTSSGFPPWGEENFAHYRTSDVETTKRSAEPHTIFMPERSAELQSRYFAAIRGDAHLNERNNATHRLVNLHYGRPASFSVDFIVDSWRRMVSDYNER